MIVDGKFEVFSLCDLDELFRDSLGVPYAAEQEGPHALTLGAYERVCGIKGETYMSKRKIADFANVPLKTFEKHLRKNIDNGWLVNKGRRKRRTATISLSERFRVEIKQGKRLYPRIFDERFTWSMKVILAYVTNQTRAQQAGLSETISEWWEPLVRKHSTIARNTGLSVPAIRNAVRELTRLSYLAVDSYGEGVYEIALEDIQVKRFKSDIFTKSPSAVSGQSVHLSGNRTHEKQGSEPKRDEDSVEISGGSTYPLSSNHYQENLYSRRHVEEQDFLADVDVVDLSWMHDRLTEEP